MVNKTVLIVVPHDAALSEYMRLFSSGSAVTPVFYFTYESVFFPQLESKRLRYICSYATNSKPKNKLRNLIGEFLDGKSIGIFLQTYILKNFLATKLRKSIEKSASNLEFVVVSHDVTALLVSSDRSCGIEAGAILCGKNLKLPVYVLSFAYSADYRSCYKLRRAKIYSVSTTQPAKVVHYDEELGNKAFYRPFETQALKELNLLSENPWVLGAGQTNCMLLDSEYERERLLMLGGKVTDYVVTGLASHDILFKNLSSAVSLRETIFYRYGLSEVFTIVISLPQYWEHGLCDIYQHFRALNDMVKSLAELHVNVLVSLHPKMKRANYEWVHTYKNVLLVREDISELLPICDLFVATYSSTVAWALMCQKKIAIIDHMGLAYFDFYREFNLPVFDENEKLVSYINETIRGRGRSDTTPVYPAEIVAKLSPFDGRCTSRIIDFLAGGDSGR